MKKILVVLIVLLVCSVPVLALANSESALEKEAQVNAFDIMYNAGNVDNLTKFTDNDIVLNKDVVSKKIVHMQSEVEKELTGVDRNSINGIPVTVEITEVDNDITYTYNYTEGEEPKVTLTDTIVAIGDFSLEQNDDLVKQIASENDIHAISGLCSGPCSKQTPDPIPGGLGVRLPMTYQNGNILSFSVDTSDSNDTQEPVDANNKSLGGACYLYGGFNATCNNKPCNSDMGLIYQKLKNTNTWSWKPFYRVTYYEGGVQKSIMSNLSNTDQNGNPGQIWGANGFIPGEIVAIEIRIDSVVNGTKSDVVLRTEGKAFHATSSGTGNETYLIQATRYKNNGNYFPKITSANNWKLLAHPANNNSSSANDSQIVKAYVAGDFRNIKINNATPAFANTERDFGYAEKTSSNRYWLQSCKGY